MNDPCSSNDTNRAAIFPVWLPPTGIVWSITTSPVTGDKVNLSPSTGGGLW